MAHLALYRKWRPDVFEDIVGQEHITKTLKNQILTNRVGHAYLFCGTRGTGKTTCAKVFSRAVNCLSPKDGSPCNECSVCRGIADGSILDVTELDAASNRRIDDIREIISDVSYVAADAKYSVYIIDEVHMLTTEAFNALLKTLEEPPEHVIFILATTDPQKVPQTILSRCQRFDFKRISINDITVRLKEVAYGDGFNITDDAYHLIARLGEGSMRDSLSVMERVVSACGDTISADDIINVLGISTQDSVFAMTEAITNNNPEQIVSVIDSLMNEGKDLNTFVDSLMQYFRDLMMYSVSNGTIALDYSSEDMVKLKAQSSRLTFERITRAASILSEAKSDAKWVKSPRIIYELALIKLARPEIDSSPEALLDRIAQMENRVHSARDEELYSRIIGIEEKIKNGLVAAAPAPVEEVPKTAKKVSKRIYNPIPQSELNGDNPLVALAKRWDNICAAIIKKAGYLGMALNNRPITIDRDGIIMLFSRKETTTLDILNNNRDRLDTLFAQISGTDYALKYVYDDEIGDNIIDIWSMKASAPAPAPDTDIPDEDLPELPPLDEGSADPMDELLQDFSEIVDITDGTEFMEYRTEDDDFDQTSLLGDSNEREEFLEPGELGDEDE